MGNNINIIELLGEISAIVIRIEIVKARNPISFSLWVVHFPFHQENKRRR